MNPVVALITIVAYILVCLHLWDKRPHPFRVYVFHLLLTVGVIWSFIEVMK